MVLPAPENLLLKAHLEILDHLQLQVGNSEKWIQEAVIGNQAVTSPRTILGLGKVLSALVAMEIDDIHRFSCLSESYVPMSAWFPAPMPQVVKSAMATCYPPATAG